MVHTDSCQISSRSFPPFIMKRQQSERDIRNYNISTESANTHIIRIGCITTLETEARTHEHIISLRE